MNYKPLYGDYLLVAIEELWLRRTETGLGSANGDNVRGKGVGMAFGA